MEEENLKEVLAQLIEAFSGLEKPSPLTTYDGSYCNEDVDYFNATDWDTATYYDYVEGMEGAIICSSRTKAYLIPKLFQIVLLRRFGVASDGAENNLSTELEFWPIDEEVERLLNFSQKKAIVAAWAHLDTYRYYHSGSHVARLLAEHWNI
ncbi:MAG: hypothetical protein ABJ370_13310 [Paracoccaceae bacterium]